MNRERVPLAVGQVWREWDPRYADATGRRVTIAWVDAHVRIVGPTGRITHARLDRFGGRGWGAYRYHDEDQPK